MRFFVTTRREGKRVFKIINIKQESLTTHEFMWCGRLGFIDVVTCHSWLVEYRRPGDESAWEILAKLFPADRKFIEDYSIGQARIELLSSANQETSNEQDDIPF